MTYSIFDREGNLIDAFATSDESLDALAAVARDAPAVAGEVFMVAQDHEGNFVGETIYGSSRGRGASQRGSASA